MTFVMLYHYSNAMPNYTKLFNSIITSTIWTEDDKTRIMWITMLAMSDKHGEVHASIPGLARLSGMSVDEAEKAINKLLSPDEYSRTPDNEGRRIVAINGGWELLNHGKYRLMASKEDEKAANADRVRRYRARNGDVTACNGNVMGQHYGNDHVTVGRDIAEAKAEADTNTESRKKNKRGAAPPLSRGTLDELRSYAVDIGLTSLDGESMFHHWESNGWRNGSNAVKNWKSGIQKWKQNGWLPSQKTTTTNGSTTRKPSLSDLMGGRTLSITKASDLPEYDPSKDQEEPNI